MRISYCFGGQFGVFERVAESITIGRCPPGATGGPDLDLNPDLTVSRSHARLWREGGQYFIEDTSSTHGTQINGEEIRGAGPYEVFPEDHIRIGETILRIEGASSPVGANSRAHSVSTRASTSRAAQIFPSAEIEGEVAGEMPVTNDLLSSAPSDTIRRFGFLFDLILQCGTATHLDELLQQMIEQLLEMIPGAERGALLLNGRDNAGKAGALLLKAFSSGQGPVVSETLARRAMQKGSGFIWTRRDESAQSGASIARFQIEAALYAPLMWQGEALGVLCVDHPGEAIFNSDDLRLLMTAAHFLALALANQNLQEELRRESAIKANLLRQFPPQMAEQLLAHGKPQLSGERSEVTILSCDIRGFTQLTQHMQPIDVMEMLNDYFSRLTPIIFAHNGMVDKYIGDAILAVFGIPQKDPMQHLNALHAALAMQEEMVKSNRARASKGRAICQIGIGVHSGEVLHGIIGPAEQIQTTVIGDTVNRATRYGDAAKPGEILLSPQVYQWVWKEVEVEATTIDTKHEGVLPGFKLQRLKETPPS
jgi:adenylate cyclase